VSETLFLSFWCIPCLVSFGWLVLKKEKKRKEKKRKEKKRKEKKRKEKENNNNNEKDKPEGTAGRW